MYTNITKHTYNIALPTDTSKEVKDWFELMESRNQLTYELINLVNENIKVRQINKNQIMENNEDSCLKEEFSRDISKKAKKELEDDVISSLYNWQESTNAIFTDSKEMRIEIKEVKEVNEVKEIKDVKEIKTIKEKKKMLIV